MNYYPFGAEFCDNGAKNYTQKHKYNGKELDRMHGLNTYDYGARQHDPILGRWDRIDPLCEKYYSTSPYVYCANNPVMLTDPDGRDLFIRASTNDEYDMLLKLVQGLTNDLLTVNYKTGKVTIASHNSANKGKTYKVGTSLVRTIIKKDRKMTIETTNGKTREKDSNETNATNGVGTDATIYINLKSNLKFITQNQKTKKINMNEDENHIISLGHEMIHGYRAMFGIGHLNKRLDRNYHGIYFPFGKSDNETMEELETTGIPYWTVKNWNKAVLGRKVGRQRYSENSLRAEHGMNIRIVY